MQLLMLTSSGCVMGRCFQNTLPTSFAAWLIAAAVLATKQIAAVSLFIRRLTY